MLRHRMVQLPTITKAKLDDAVRESRTMGDVVFTIQRCYGINES